MKDEVLEQLARVIKAFASLLRIKIVLLLLRYEELTVSDLVNMLEESQSLISHHLSVLRDANILTVEERGRFRVYKINSEYLSNLAQELLSKIIDKKSRDQILDFLLTFASIKNSTKKIEDQGEGGSRRDRVSHAYISATSRHC